MIEIRQWEEVRAVLFDACDSKSEAPSLLLGNGASIAVTDTFGYPSLFQSAELDEVARGVFRAFGSTDFEYVLGRLHTAMLVNQALDEDCLRITDLYQTIRQALIQSLADVHIRGAIYNPHEALSTEIPSYHHIYSSNYDLLLYWAMLHHRCQRNRAVVDMFIGEQLTFDPYRQWDGDSTVLHYLHGAIHLYLDQDGVCRKRNADRTPIMNQLRDGRSVHFVSEGTWQAKKARIDASPYLSHCYSQLVSDSNDLVIFGHSLDEETDRHILNAIIKHTERRIAVSVYTHGREAHDLQAQMNATIAKLRGIPAEQILFFDSVGHPFGFPGQGCPFDVVE